MFLDFWNARALRQASPRSCAVVLLKLAGVCVGLVGIARAEDLILEWNAVMIQANAVDCSQAVQQQPGPILVARAFAMTSAAMYDALNSIENIGAPYLTVAPNAAGGSIDAAVAQAAHDTLVALYSAQTAVFDAALTETLARIPDGPNKDQGIAVGQYVATQMFQARASDGAANIDTPPSVPIDAPGFHQADPTQLACE